MKISELNDWLSLLANLGVIAGLVFVALEIQTNTETNQISIFQGTSTNWMEINGNQLNPEVAELLEKAFSEQELSNIEKRQFEGWVLQQLTHAAYVRRLHRAGLLSDDELRLEYEAGIRKYRSIPRFQLFVESLVASEDDFRRLILSDDGIEWWLSQ